MLGIIVLAVAFGEGCSRPVSSDVSPSDAATTKAAHATPLQHDTWEIFRIGGVRVGYGHWSVLRGEQAGQAALTIDDTQHLEIERGGQATQQDVSVKWTQTPEGRLLGFQSELRQGPTPVRMNGRVVGGQLVVETESSGKRTTATPAWSPDCQGPRAAELSLLAAPLKPGQRRAVRWFDASTLQMVQTDLAARDFEQTELVSGSFRLLRIDVVMRLGDGQKIGGAVWTDLAGAVLKSRIDLLGMESLTVPQEIAAAKTTIGKFDLWDKSLVKLDRPLERAHDTRKVRYRLHLDEGNPAEAFCTSPAQSVHSIDANTAEIIVRAVRPGAGTADLPDAASTDADRPTDADRVPNNFIQSDDKLIVENARQAAPSEKDPWRIAVALERFVHDHVTQKDFSQAFATAADVARSQEGDCTEHAVYLAALARARGIPARVAVGLVYVPSIQAFGGHMWTEVYIDRRWVGVDGTLAKAGIGGGHLKMASSPLDGTAAYTSFLPVLRILGRLKIEVLEAE